MHLLMVTNPQYERLRPSRPPVFLPLLPDLSASSQCPLDELLLGRAKTPTAGFGFHLVLTPFSGPPSLLGIWPEKGQEDPLSQLSQSFPVTLQATASQPLYLGIRV